MTRFELRWLRRHPLRWLRYTWVHWSVSLILLALAIAESQEVFVDQLRYGEVWPLALAAVAGAVALSSFAPLAPRVQAAVGVALAGLACAHIAVYAEMLRIGDVSIGGRSVLWVLIAHWTLMLLVAATWPRLSTVAGVGVMIDAGHDDRGQG